MAKTPTAKKFTRLCAFEAFLKLITFSRQDSSNIYISLYFQNDKQLLIHYMFQHVENLGVLWENIRKNFEELLLLSKV